MSSPPSLPARLIYAALLAMIRVCLVPSLALVAVGCGSVLNDRNGVPDASVDGSADAAPDASGMVASVRVDTPTSVNAASVSSSPLPLAAGNLVIAIPYWNDRSHHIVMSDSSGAMTWKSTARQSVANGCGAGTNLQIFYATIPSSATVTLTATQPEGAGNMGLFVVEYRGLTADPLDGAVGMPAPRAANAMTTGTLTTTSSDLLVAAFHDSNGSGTMVPGSGFTVLGLDTNAYGMFADQVVPPGSYEATARLPEGANDACWVASMIALRAR